MRLSLDLGPGSIATLNAGGGVVYEAETDALVARFTTPPTTERKNQINTLILDLKTAGVWSKLDALYVMAAADAQAAQRNWIADQYNLSEVSAPVFTEDRGYQGNGTSSYLETGLNPATAVGALFVQNSGHLAMYSRTAAQGNSVDMGNGNSLLQLRNTSDLFGNRINAAGSNQPANTNALGLFVSSRTTSTLTSPYRDGVALATAPTGSEAVSSTSIRILGRSGTVSYSARQASFASIGAGLTVQNVTDLTSAVVEHLTAVGAAGEPP